LNLIRCIACSAVVGSLLLAATAHAAPPTPQLTEWVNDGAHVLSQPQIDQLTNFLKDEEARTSNQVVILTIPSLNGEDIADYSIRAARNAKIGQKQQKNGVLVVVATQDHKMRIEVGFGLEGVLTDALSGEIIRNEMTPEFRAGNYFGGLWAGVHAIDKAIRGEYKGTGALHQNPSTVHIEPGFVLFWMLFFILVLASHVRFRRYRNHWLGPVWISTPSSGFGSGSSGGGFFDGGGGGGGFSGGGGGFGGGGASGGW
jgi:uncharacterized protein